MKIEDLRSEKKGNRARVAATVTWEDCDRPAQEIYFETIEEFAKDISCNPHAFLVACILPAMRFGEKRIAIDAAICPELHNGLITAMSLICNWYDWYTPENNLVRLEFKKRHYVSSSIDGERAGFLFSGGVDSLATLRANRLSYSKKHPGFIKDGLLIYGLEVRELDKFELVLASLSILAQDAGVTLIPVYINIRDLGPEDHKVFWGDFWLNEFMGATFAAVAHVFSKRLGVLSINSCHDIPNLIPYGSHPLLNPLYSGSDLRIRHEGIHLSRFEKVRLISDWDLALQHLRVCNRSNMYEPNVLNCGKCEKCIRTMLAFVAAGALHKSTAFPSGDVTAGQISKSVDIQSNTLPHYLELLEPLMKIGRGDLVNAIKQKIKEYHVRPIKQKVNKYTIEPIKEFDMRYLKGNLKKLKQMVFAQRTAR